MICIRVREMKTACEEEREGGREKRERERGGGMEREGWTEREGWM